MPNEKVEQQSKNMQNENLEKLRRVFPQFVKDGEVDFDALKVFFDAEGVVAGEERYGLNWAGKSNAFKAIRVPSTGTLSPQESESKNWDTTENLFLEGDNLEVLKLLQKHYREQIKMIYIDPPYNTGKDFIYKDNFTENLSDYYERTGQSAGGVKLTANLESNGRYHSDWLTMMYPRLFLARNLLRDDGVIFISIDDNEVHNLRMIMDEIFGEENFVGSLIWAKKRKGSFLSDEIISVTEYCVIYAKNRPVRLYGGLPDTNESQPIVKRTNSRKRLSFADNLVQTKLVDGEYKAGEYGHGSSKVNLLNSVHVANGVIINSFVLEGPFIWTQDMLNQELSKEGSKVVINTLNFQPRVFRVYNDESSKGLPSLLFGVDISGTNEDGYEEIRGIFGIEKLFDYPKPVNYIKYLLNAATFFDKDALILDFFAGSGTTAHAVMQLNVEDGGNRKWICVQLPEETDEKSEARKAGYKTISEISRERIRRTADTIETLEELADRDGSDVDTGFKSLKLTKSNYRQWDAITDRDDEKKLKAQLKLAIEKPLVDGYDEKSVVYEILTKEGFSLNSQVSQAVIPVKAGVYVWVVADGERKIVVSFAKQINKEQVDAFGLTEADIFVCLDSAMDDTTKVNIARNLNVKVI